MSDSHYKLLTTCCPDEDSAHALASILLEQKLVASVNILPAMHSLYRWEGKIVADSEVLVVMKTVETHIAAIEAEVLRQHPYEVPELICIPIESGAALFLQWIDDSVQ